MSFADEILLEVREQIEPTETPLAEARDRLRAVRNAADSFPGRNRTYRSGSLAVHTMNEPVTDGDGGIVLNRVNYPRLGPEGGTESPGEVVDELCNHLGPIIRKTYPNAIVRKSKRGPKVFFNAPLWDGQDPTVDLIVALTRKVGDGLWIPNLQTEEWDPSNPEKHVQLLNGGTASHRSIRRKVIRLAKAWNKQFSQPGMASFVLSVWAWEFLEPGTGVATGLRTLFECAAERLEAGGSTPDPAGVSADLKLEIKEAAAAIRLRTAARAIEAAIIAESEQDARIALAGLYPDYLEDPNMNALKTAASALRSGAAVSGVAVGVAITGAATTANARSYGNAPH